MKRYDNVLEKDDMLISQRNSESTNDTGQNVKKLSSTVEFMILVNQSKEAFIDGLTDHLSSRHKFGVELVKNVLQIVSFD